MRSQYNAHPLAVRCALIVLAVFLISLAVGALAPLKFPQNAIAPPSIEAVLNINRGAALRRIFLRNFLVLVLIWVGVLTAGSTSVLQVAWNGLRLGLLTRQYDPSTLIALVLPHAVLEFSALLIATTTSLWLVFRLIKGAMAGKAEIGQDMRKLLPWACLSVILIFVAAVVEVYVTPQIAAHLLTR